MKAVPDTQEVPAAHGLIVPLELRQQALERPGRLALFQGAGFRVQGSGCRVQGAGFRVQG